MTLPGLGARRIAPYQGILTLARGRRIHSGSLLQTLCGTAQGQQDGVAKDIGGRGTGGLARPGGVELSQSDVDGAAGLGSVLDTGTQRNGKMAQNVDGWCSPFLPQEQRGVGEVGVSWSCNSRLRRSATTIDNCSSRVALSASSRIERSYLWRRRCPRRASNANSSP